MEENIEQDLEDDNNENDLQSWENLYLLFDIQYEN